MESEKMDTNEQKCNCSELPSYCKQPGTNHSLSCPKAPKCTTCTLPLIICQCQIFINDEKDNYVYNK